MHGYAVYVKEGLPFGRDLQPEHSAESYLCFRLVLLHSVSYFFFLYRSPPASLSMVFDSILPNIGQVHSINPSANVLIFADYNVHHKDRLTYSARTDRPGERCYTFCISNDLTQMVNFTTRNPECDSVRLVIVAKKVLEAAKLAYATKKKNLSLPTNFANC